MQWRRPSRNLNFLIKAIFIDTFIIMLHWKPVFFSASNVFVGVYGVALTSFFKAIGGPAWKPAWFFGALQGMHACCLHGYHLRFAVEINMMSFKLQMLLNRLWLWHLINIWEIWFNRLENLRQIYNSCEKITLL